MKASKQKQLEATGWSVGSASEFLELSDAEEMLVNMKLALARKVKEMRLKKKLTQQALARLIGSSQSRVAKLEVADRSVSMELLVRSLVTMGATRAQVGRIVGTQVVQPKSSASKKRLVKR